MDIKILDYFLAFTEEENISRTAQKLHISQPSLSRYLMQLEHYFDTELFIRENRNIKLTKEGMIVRDNVREILDIIEKTHDEIKKSKKDFCGDIYIGCSAIDYFDKFTTFILNFQKNYPRIRFHIINDSSDAILDKINKGIIDFGLIIESEKMEDSNYNRILYDKGVKWGFLMNKENALSEKKNLKENDLYSEKIIYPSYLYNKKDLARLFKEPKKLNIVSTYNFMGSINKLIENDFGIALCDEKVEYNEEKLCFVPANFIKSGNVCIICKKKDNLSKAAEIFLEELLFKM